MAWLFCLCVMHHILLKLRNQSLFCTPGPGRVSDRHHTPMREVKRGFIIRVFCFMGRSPCWRFCNTPGVWNETHESRKKKFFVQVFSVGHILRFIPKLWVCKDDAKKLAQKQKVRKGDSDGEVRRSLTSTQLYFQLHLSIGFCTV